MRNKMDVERKRKSNQMDMLNGSLAKNILFFALPLAASSILQQLFNSVDVAVVGRFAGDDALAAVSANSSVTALFINIFVGLTVGANVVIAKYIGQGKKKEIQDVLHTVIAFAIISGICMLLLGQVIARPLLELISTPEGVLDLAVCYLRIYFMGIPFVIVYNFGAAILRSMGDTRRPMYCLIISGVTNGVLNIILVVGFHLDVAGVAIATAVADAISAIIVLSILCREEEFIRLHPRKLKIHGKHLIHVLKVGMPAAIQSGVFSISNVCIQTGINSFGDKAVSGSSVGLNFEYFCYYIINAFAQAAVTFTSQNFGARKIDRCKKLFRISMIEGMLLTAILSAVFTIWGRFFTGLYTVNTVVMSFALIRMHHVMMLEFLTGTYEISGGVLRGLGHSMAPASLTVLGSVCFRIFWLYTVFRWQHSFSMLMSVYPVSWELTGTMVLTAYFIITRKEYGAVRKE